MTNLNPLQDGEYQPSWAGTIAELASILFDELVLSGDSIVDEEVEKSIIDHTRIYAGWELLHFQKESSAAVAIDKDFKLELGEWAIVVKVVRAHLDLIHAKRNDGSGAISGERTGKDIMSAQQDYQKELDEMPRNAFSDTVYSV